MHFRNHDGPVERSGIATVGGLGERTEEEPHVGAVLQISRLTKSFGLQPVLEDLDLDIRAGEIHALVGENGSGKSTTIKILSGYHVPDPGGEILIEGNQLPFGSPASSYTSGLRFVHQDLGLIETSSILDNMALSTGFPTRMGSIRSREAVRIAARDLSHVGLDVNPQRLVEDLSPSGKTGVAIARALRMDPEAPVKVLVLDEPTATLPLSEVENLLAIIREAAARGVAVLYVSHRIDEIFELSQRVTVFRDGRPVATRSTADLDHEGLVQLLIGRELEEVKASRVELANNSHDVVLKVQALTSAPLNSLSFETRHGEILGMAGITGSGRETVLPAIFGVIERTGGTVEVEGVPLVTSSPEEAISKGIAYLPPDRKIQGGIMEFSARENMMLTDVKRFWRMPFLRRKEEAAEVVKWFAELDVRPAEAIEQNFGLFSGGNQQKILFAKWLRCAPKVLMLNEPTQGVDIGAKTEIHRRILQTARDGATVIVTSVDVDELVALCHRVLVFRHGTVIAEISGEDLTFNAVASASLAGKVEVTL